MTMPEPINQWISKDVPMPMRPTELVAQEIYLLERYSSPEYFLTVRDAWEAMIRHVERCLDLFMRRLPPDYRSRPLPHQPDIVWGERVLPNFQRTLQHLNESYTKIKRGELQALGWAGETEGDMRGAREFWSGWMSEASVENEISNAEQDYWDLARAATLPAANIRITIRATWNCTSLRHKYPQSVRGPLNPPDRWPRYRLNPTKQARTGEPIPYTGIYLPDIENSCAALLIEGNKDAKATVLTHVVESFDRETRIKENESPVSESRSAIWTLIERVPGDFVEDGLADLLIEQLDPQLRVPAGHPCPRLGYWFTPAKQGSQRYFKQGEVFPNIEASAYGETFWQWLPDQQPTGGTR